MCVWNVLIPALFWFVFEECPFGRAACMLTICTYRVCYIPQFLRPNSRVGSYNSSTAFQAEISAWQQNWIATRCSSFTSISRLWHWATTVRARRPFLTTVSTLTPFCTLIREGLYYVVQPRSGGWRWWESGKKFCPGTKKRRRVFIFVYLLEIVPIWCSTRITKNCCCWCTLCRMANKMKVLRPVIQTVNTKYGSYTLQHNNKRYFMNLIILTTYILTSSCTSDDHRSKNELNHNQPTCLTHKTQLPKEYLTPSRMWRSSTDYLHQLRNCPPLREQIEIRHKMKLI